jgi:hypothetical protein
MQYDACDSLASLQAYLRAGKTINHRVDEN